MSDSSLNECPVCKGIADNGFSRDLPPDVYLCTKCVAKEGLSVFPGVDDDGWPLEKQREITDIEMCRIAYEAWAKLHGFPLFKSTTCTVGDQQVSYDDNGRWMAFSAAWSRNAPKPVSSELLDVIQGKTPDAQKTFTANWLRGEIVIPDEVKLRIWLMENEKRGLKPVMEG
jgi:hypothetical protein